MEANEDLKSVQRHAEQATKQLRDISPFGFTLSSRVLQGALFGSLFSMVLLRKAKYGFWYGAGFGLGACQTPIMGVWHSLCLQEASPDTSDQKEELKQKLAKFIV